MYGNHWASWPSETQTKQAVFTLKVDVVIMDTLGRQQSTAGKKIFEDFFFFVFYFGASAPGGPGPRKSRGF
jgi:hypothetical protein